MTAFSHTPDAPEFSSERRGTPDPGSRGIARALAVIVTLLIITIAAMQQFAAAGGGAKPTTTNAPAISAPDNTDPLVLDTNLQVKFRHLPGLPQQQSAMMSSGFLTPTIDGSGESQFRLAIRTAELNGKPSGTQALDAITTPYEGANEDKATLTALLDSAPQTLTPEQRETFIRRHGYFAKLALSWSKPDADPARAPFIEGGWSILIAIIGVVCLVVFLGLMCIVAWIMLVRWHARGNLRPRFIPPAPGGSVFLEVVALFVVGFILLHVGIGKLETSVTPKDGEPPAWLTPLRLSLQWLLLLTPLWALRTGVPWSDIRKRIGLYSGEGFWKEVFCGLLGYAAAMVVFLAAILITLGAVLVRSLLSKEYAGPPSNPITELVGGASPGVLLLFFALATLWAPLAEELIFRGCLYRHMRSTWPWWAAAIVSALAFGLMHGYAWFMLTPVIALGGVFALMREWRGSLIAPMVAHCVHNATALTVAIVLMRVLTPSV